MNKILVIGGDLWHPLEIIKKGFQGIAGLKAELEFIEDAKDSLTVEKLSQYPLIINCKGNTLTSGNPAPWFEESVTEVGPEELSTYVENGGSFLAIHAANSFHENQVEQQPRFLKPCEQYIDLIGNRFLSHPLRCMVSAKNINSDHPIMRDVQEFSARDEHYQIELLSDDVELL
ncbi:MAG: ThuA domain-containing protein, partial [Lachnospiraceae bacterium]|nr:ThuA domain-containing protein [Lachnospiraceae bacterium]